jgi:hypothetical protein
VTDKENLARKIVDGLGIVSAIAGILGVSLRDLISPGIPRWVYLIPIAAFLPYLAYRRFRSGDGRAKSDPRINIITQFTKLEARDVLWRWKWEGVDPDSPRYGHPADLTAFCPKCGRGLLPKTRREAPLMGPRLADGWRDSVPSATLYRCNCGHEARVPCTPDKIEEWVGLKIGEHLKAMLPGQKPSP